MKWTCGLTVLLVIISLSDLTFGGNSTSGSSNGDRRIKSVEAACSEQAMMGQIHLQEPFYGAVYVRGYPLECRAFGNGSREVTIIFSVNKCGTKITKLPNGKTQFEAVIYLQFDDKMQKLSDETYLLSCTSQNVVVMSPRMAGMGSQTSAQPSAKTPTPSKPVKEYDFDGWLDILQGKLPSLLPVTKPVFVGENLTVLIKIKHPDGFDAKVMNCIASDGTDMNKHLLIDSDGCALDSNLMPSLREKRGTKPFAKVFYTTLQAFKFPRRRSLHIRCSVLFCNDTCLPNNCDSPWGRMQPMMQDEFFIGLKNLEVSDSVEVLARTNDSKTSSFQEQLTGTGSTKEELYCLNSTRILILISILLSVLLMSLVITICTCVRAKELRRRLLSQSFPYGKVSACS